jgi:hypothetical protein
MRIKLDRGYLYMPAVFLLGYQCALLWVTGTLENTFDIRFGVQIPLEVLTSERRAVREAKSWIGFVTGFTIFAAILVDQFLQRRARRDTEASEAALENRKS